jgi:hypothetical protein
VNILLDEHAGSKFELNEQEKDANIRHSLAKQRKKIEKRCFLEIKGVI